MAFRPTVIALLEAAFAAHPAAPPVRSDQNVAFTPPQDLPWIDVAFQDGSERTVAIGGQGGNLFRSPVLAFVTAFTPTNQGDGLAAELVEVAKAALRYEDIEGHRWESFDAGPEGESRGEWRKQLIAIFRRTIRV